MKVTDYLKNEDTFLLQNCKSRTDLYKTLVPSYVLTEKNEKISKDKIIKIIEQREKGGSLIVREGCAIPHARLENMTNPILKFAYIKDGIIFETDKVCNLVVLFITPLNKSKIHLEIMAKVLTLLKKEEIIHRMKNAQNVNEIYEIIKQEENMANINYSTLTKEQIFSDLVTSEIGLSTEEADERVKKNSENILKNSNGSGFRKLIKNLFSSSKEIETSEISIFLKQFIPENTKVIRNGEKLEIKTSELVAGDIAIFEEGDIITADARIIESCDMTVDNSKLTGEITNISKNAEATKTNSNYLWEELPNMLFAGTKVTKGNGKAIVVATGMNTEIGITLAIIQSSKHRTESPVELNKNILLKQSANNLGMVSAIVTDKAGILTRKELSVSNLYINDKSYEISGEAYSLIGDYFDEFGKKVEKDTLLKDDIFSKFLNIAHLCNNSSLEPADSNETFNIIGDPLEAALLILTKKTGFDMKKSKSINKRVKYFPFETGRKRISIINENQQAENFVYTKGDPLEILEVCEYLYSNDEIKKLALEDWKKIKEEYDKFTSDGLKTLAFAYKKVDNIENLTKEDAEKGLIFVSMAAMKYPYKADVPGAIKKCKDADIKVIISTGDYEINANVLAKDIGLIENKEDSLTMTGFELSAMNDNKLEEVLASEKTLIFSRMDSIQKMRVADCLKNIGHSVAVTAVGLNDAIALICTDVGVAMGDNLSNAVKETANMIILDGSFASLVNVICEKKNGK